MLFFRIVIFFTAVISLCLPASAQVLSGRKASDSMKRQVTVSVKRKAVDSIRPKASDRSKRQVTFSGKHKAVDSIRRPIDLKELTVSGKQSNTAFHTLSRLDLDLRPVNSSQDLMRLVPGLFIAQHMGGGKAEQIFIRGFDADHGSDVQVSADGIPVNMASHIHGQGYADLHFLIPETIAAYDFGKGPYYTGYGDFTTAGYLSYTTKEAIDKSMISLEGGSFHTGRLMAMVNLLDNKHRKNGSTAYIAGEYTYTDGAFNFPERYKRLNLFSKYSTRLGEHNKLMLGASFFTTSWRASGEIPERAAESVSRAVDDDGRNYSLRAGFPLVSRFATIDSTQGGKSSRVNLNLKLQTELSPGLQLENQLYYSHYTFLLHVNSTFYAGDSLNGDNKQQQENRDLYGYSGKITRKNFWKNSSLTSTAGISERMDAIHQSEYSNVSHTYSFLSDISRGKIWQLNSAAYLDETIESGHWLLNAGSRIDNFNFRYHDSSRTKTIISPKLNIQYTLNAEIQFFIKAGKGFHSNNAIAVIGNKGLETLPSAYGTDLGLNWKPLPRLYVNAAVWYLFLAEEFVYTDDGDIAPGGRTTRKGIDISTRYQLNNWLFASLNINLSRSRLTDSAAGKAYLALAPGLTSTGGLDFRFKHGINGGISYRYMHSRPGNNTASLMASGYRVTDLRLNYTRRRYEIGLSVENLLNTRWNEFEAERLSRLKGEKAAVDQMSFTAGTPLSAKLRLAVFL